MEANFNLNEATMDELVAYYNKFSGKPPVKRFKNRAYGQEKCMAIILAENNPEAKENIAVTEEQAELQPVEQTNETEGGQTEGEQTEGTPETEGEQTEGEQKPEAHACPLCKSENVKDDTGPTGDERWACDDCGKITWKATGKEYKTSQTIRENQSKAVSESWKDPVVAAKRKERHSVTVDGVAYKSVLDAFKALKLSISKHIPFRAKLKAAGAAGLDWKEGDRTYHFVAFEVVKEEKPAPTVTEGGKKRGRPTKEEAAAKEQAARAESTADADEEAEPTNSDEVDVTEVE